MALRSGEVLLLGGAENAEIVAVQMALEALDAPFRVVDLPDFPEKVHLSHGMSGWSIDGKSLEGVRSIYVRALGLHPLMPGSAVHLAERPTGWIAQCDEKRALVESFLLEQQAAGVPLFNAPEVNAQHHRKPYQLHLLATAGLPVPAWLATNDPDAVRDFLVESGQVIYKPLAGGALVQALCEKDLTTGRLAALTLAPVLFQVYVAGASVRVYVVDGRVVAAGDILSSHLDYRAGDAEAVATALSSEEEQLAVHATQVCGMGFSGVDLIRGEAGSVVLECNPSPMFAGFEAMTGADVAGPLAEALLRG